MRIAVRIVLCALVSAGACGDTTSPFAPPTIGFDRSTYTVILNAGATAVVSQPTPVITVTRGSDALPPVLSIGLDPDGYCNVGAGVGFAFSGAQWTISGTETSISRSVDFVVCPTITGAQTIPKGSTTIQASYSFSGKTYTATATVVVQ